VVWLAVTVVDQHVDGLLRPRLGVLVGDQRLALTPALDALEQRAAHVPRRLAGGQRGVEVDVRLDEGRHHQIAGGVDIALVGFGWCLLRADGGNPRAV